MTISAQSLLHMDGRAMVTSNFIKIGPYGYIDLSNEVLMQILSYGDKYLPNNLNRNILELTL